MKSGAYRSTEDAHSSCLATVPGIRGVNLAALVVKSFCGVAVSCGVLPSNAWNLAENAKRTEMEVSTPPNTATPHFSCLLL